MDAEKSMSARDAVVSLQLIWFELFARMLRTKPNVDWLKETRLLCCGPNLTYTGLNTRMLLVGI